MAVKIYNTNTKYIKIGSANQLKIWSATQDEIKSAYPYLSAYGQGFDWKQYGYQTLTINPVSGVIDANFDMGQGSKRSGTNPFGGDSLFTMEYKENLDVTSDVETEATWTVLDSEQKYFSSNYNSYEINLTGLFQGAGWYRSRHQYDPESGDPRYGLSLICEVGSYGEILSAIYIRDTQPTNTSPSTTTITSNDIN